MYSLYISTSFLALLTVRCHNTTHGYRAVNVSIQPLIVHCRQIPVQRCLCAYLLCRFKKIRMGYRGLLWTPTIFFGDEDIILGWWRNDLFFSMQYSLLYRFSFFLVKNCVGYNIQFFLYSLNIIIDVNVNIFKYSHLAYFLNWEAVSKQGKEEEFPLIMEWSHDQPSHMNHMWVKMSWSLVGV